MMISTKGRYAMRFLLDVAERQGDGFVPLKDVAARQEISEKYLEIVVKELVKGGLLDTLRGKGGGYRLNRPPEEYSVKAIIERMEGPLAPVACLEPGTGNLSPEGGMSDSSSLAGAGQGDLRLSVAVYPGGSPSGINVGRVRVP